NALITLNLRPAHRAAWGFDDRKARSMTDSVDDDLRMPDALEVAAALDAQFARTGRLAGPLHGIVFSIKDMLDTFDMRTTAGADELRCRPFPVAGAGQSSRLTGRAGHQRPPRSDLPDGRGYRPRAHGYRWPRPLR